MPQLPLRAALGARAPVLGPAYPRLESWWPIGPTVAPGLPGGAATGSPVEATQPVATQTAAGPLPENVATVVLQATPERLNGNPAVQPTVTQCTMNLHIAGSGVTMDGKPVSSDERAFARTEVAGLDDVPNDKRGVMVERRGAPATQGFQGTQPPALAGERLDPDGQRWLRSLPVAVRPLITAKRHPHIVNKLARVWDRPAALAAYMDDLLISSRPGRRGFAMEVLDELVLLQHEIAERSRRR